MSDTGVRDTVLARVRTALGADADNSARARTVKNRLEGHPANLIPKRAQTGREERIDLFTKMLESQSARVSFAKSADEIPEIVSSYLREHNLPAEFRTGNDAQLGEIPWNKAPSLTRHTGRSQGGDAVAMSRAQAGAAETGTLFLASGEDNPTTLNFLPDTHIAVIRAEDIHGPYEDAWNALRKVYGEGTLPRTVNLISGPSRTADIEQIMVMGAHGPRNLHVIVLG